MGKVGRHNGSQKKMPYKDLKVRENQVDLRNYWELGKSLALTVLEDRVMQGDRHQFQVCKVLCNTSKSGY